MLKEKGIGQMVILDQNGFGGGHHLTIPRYLHDRDVRMRLMGKPLFTEDEPFVAALPEEGVRPASIIRRQQLPQPAGLWMQQPLLFRLAVEQEPLPDQPLFRSSGEARVSLALDEVCQQIRVGQKGRLGREHSFQAGRMRGGGALTNWVSRR